jgi:monovalent cation:H+ antiporter-2, CPA2 family
MEIPLLKDIVIILLLSVIVLSVFHRLKAPTVIGFLITGIIAGPKGLGLVSAVDQVGILAEIGVVLLLFTIGIEISLKDLLKIKKYVLVGGSLQVLLTILMVFLILNHLGRPIGEAILLGFLVSLSSTAIVLRIIQEKAEFDSLHGRTILGILIFQDIIIVPMMLITPLLPGSLASSTESPLAIVVKGLALVALVIISAKWIMPSALYYIARTGDRELFMLSMIAICLGVARVSSMTGLSLGLGAFLAGLILSESPYSHQAFGNMLPLRNAFTSFFFVSIGMLVDVNFLIDNPGIIIIIALGVIALKALIAGSAIAFMGLPIRIIVLVGFALSQIGEFSFVLSKVGLENGLLSEEVYQMFLDVTVLTMGATSFIMAISPVIAEKAQKLPIPERLKSNINYERQEAKKTRQALNDHLIIVGYGINGRNVAKSAKAEGIPYIILETDPEIVRAEKKESEPIYYGDAAQEAVLQHVGIKDARVMVIAISDPGTSRRITDLARMLAPDLYIIVRTRYLEEMRPLNDLGANEVIPEEYETSIEIFCRVLERYDVPREEIEMFTAQLRSAGYSMFRSLSKEPYCDADIDIINNEVGTLKVFIGSPIEGRTIEDIGLNEYGIALLALHRGAQAIQEIETGFTLQAGDIIVLLGSENKINRIADLFKAPEKKLREDT